MRRKYRHTGSDVNDGQDQRSPAGTCEVIEMRRKRTGISTDDSTRPGTGGVCRAPGRQRVRNPIKSLQRRRCPVSAPSNPATAIAPLLFWGNLSTNTRFRDVITATFTTQYIHIYTGPAPPLARPRAKLT